MPSELTYSNSLNYSVALTRPISMRFIIRGRQYGTSCKTEASLLGNSTTILRLKNPPLALSHIAHVVFIFERFADGYIDYGRLNAIGVHPFGAEHCTPHVQECITSRLFTFNTSFFDNHLNATCFSRQRVWWSVFGAFFFDYWKFGHYHV